MASDNPNQAHYDAGREAGRNEGLIEHLGNVAWGPIDAVVDALSGGPSPAEKAYHAGKEQGQKDKNGG
jgi:hypothetical protein